MIKLFYATLYLFCLTACQENDASTTKKVPSVNLPFDALDHELFVIQNYQFAREKNRDTFKIKAGIGKIYKPDSLTITVNGHKTTPDEKGWIEWKSRHLPSLPGRKTSMIKAEYIDPITNKKVQKRQKATYVTGGRYGLENEHGKYLYREVESKCQFYADFYCMSDVWPIIKVENGHIKKARHLGRCMWVLRPNADSTTCKVQVRYCNFETTYEYQIMDVYDIRK